MTSTVTDTNGYLRTSKAAPVQRVKPDRGLGPDPVEVRTVSSILYVLRRRVRRSPAISAARGVAVSRWVRAAWPLYLTRPTGWVLGALVVFVVLPLIGGQR